MTFYTPENGSHLDKNDIFSGWHKGSIFRADLEFSIWSQRIAGLDFQYRLICHLSIK